MQALGLEVSVATDSRIRVGDGALERLQRGVRLEGLREVLRTLGTEVVVLEAAGDGANGASAAADSKGKRKASACQGAAYLREVRLLSLIHI